MNTYTMLRTICQTISVSIAASLLLSHTALAQEKGCISLKTEAQMEETYTDAQGKPAKRLVTPTKTIPGNEIIWTITANNICSKPAEKVVFENAIPEHMTYVADSAMGPGTDITYSLNGRDFVKPANLQVRDADGKTRAARPDEIKSIRWTLSAPIAANAMSFARYRAKVN